MSEENTIKETALTEKLDKLGLDIKQTSQVSYNDLRLDLVREAGVFEGAFGKEGGETLWQAFNKNRTNFYAGNRWAQSITPNGDISLLHAVPQSNRYNIFDIAKNGEIKMSRFTSGQWNWTIENAGEPNKTYKSSKGTIICHFEDETTKTKIVLKQPSIGVKDVERVISYDKNTKQRMVSYHRVIDGKRVVCDADGNVLKKGIVQTLAHTPAEGKILQSAKMEKALMENLQNIQSAPHKFPSVADMKGEEQVFNHPEEFGLPRKKNPKENLREYLKQKKLKTTPQSEQATPRTNKFKGVSEEFFESHKDKFPGYKSYVATSSWKTNKLSDLPEDFFVDITENRGAEFSGIKPEPGSLEERVLNHPEEFGFPREKNPKEAIKEFLEEQKQEELKAAPQSEQATPRTNKFKGLSEEFFESHKDKFPGYKSYEDTIQELDEASRKTNKMQGISNNLIAEVSEKNATKLEEKIEEKSVEQVVAKETAKQAEQTVTSATEKVATKSAMKATAAKAGEKVAKTAGQATKNTLLAANKAYDDTFDAIMKWGGKHAPQWMNKVEEKTVQKAAEKFMKTKSGQAIAKQIEKKVGKEIAASIAKKIPILCLGVGAVCVYDRVKEGEYLKAVGEGASALVANVPGLGTLASFGLDGAMLSDDLKVFEHGVMPRDPNSHMASESTFVNKPIVPQQQKFAIKVDKATEAKKKAAEAKKKEKSKKKATQFEANLYKYGGNSGNFFGG